MQKLNSAYQIIKVLNNFPNVVALFIYLFILPSITALFNRTFGENRNALCYKKQEQLNNSS